MSEIDQAQAAVRPARPREAASGLLTPFVLDYAFYGMAMSAVSIASFFPLFLRSLTSSNIVIGLLPALQVLGRTLPAAFAARGLEQKGRLKYLTVLWMVIERTPVLLTGVWILTGGSRSANVMLWGVMALWGAYCLGNGWANVLWSNLVSRVVPTTLRGRMGGWGGGLSGLAGIGVAALARYLFEHLGLRVGYGLCFVAAGVAMISSAFVFLTTRETPRPSEVRNVSLWGYLGGLPRVLREDRCFAWYMAARSLWTVGATAASFYTVYAIARFNAGAAQVAWLAVALSLGAVVGNVLAGFVADRVGFKLVFAVSSLLLMAAPLGAMLGGSIWFLFLVFVVNAIGQSTGFLAAQNMPLELAHEGQVATYLAINNVILGPTATLAPIAAGALLGIIGFPALFGASAVAALAAAIILWQCVPEPRKGTRSRV